MPLVCFFALESQRLPLRVKSKHNWLIEILRQETHSINANVIARNFAMHRFSAVDAIEFGN